MKLVILAGGLGHRLREETEFIPKPMVKIGDYPIIWHIMKIYSSSGFKDFIICGGYKVDLIKEYFLNFNNFNNDISIDLQNNSSQALVQSQNNVDWNVLISDTGLIANTGERIRRIKKYLNDEETFMITYGDGLSDVNINKLINFHNTHNGALTITITKPKSRFGVVKFDNNKLATSFDEKGRAEGYINSGYMVANKKIFDYLEEGDIFEENTFNKLLKTKNLYCFEHNGFFEPMDTYRESKMLNELWNTNPPWKVW